MPGEPFSGKQKSVFSFLKLPKRDVFLKKASPEVRSQQSKASLFLTFLKRVFLNGDPVTNAIRGYSFLKTCLKNILVESSIPDEKCLFAPRQHSLPGSVESPPGNPNKLLISGRSLFAWQEYFSILEQIYRFAWHTEVVRPQPQQNREVSGHVLTEKRPIRKPPSSTARRIKMTHLLAHLVPTT